MKYIYSQLSPNAVVELIKLHYNLTDPISCKFYVLGMHDNYLIESDNNKFIFRIYRNDWRTKEEIYFEVDLLHYLHKKTANVAFPITTNSSTLVNSIDCPEGKRVTVLFSYADGHAPENRISADECKLLGSSVAKIHYETGNFKTQNNRPILNLTYLVDRSLRLIKPFLTSKQIVYLDGLQLKIKSRIDCLNTENADFGICIGDINPTNFHINDRNNLTHFDFDQCGYSYRAFEIGKFSSSLYSHESKKDLLVAFIDGYEKIRQLTDIEKMSIPYFEIASIIWVMSIHVSNINKIGYKYLDNSFWSNRIGRIEALDIELV